LYRVLDTIIALLLQPAQEQIPSPMLPPLPSRRLILVSGPRDAGLCFAATLIRESGIAEQEIYRSQADQSALDTLGQDFSLLIIDAYVGLNPDLIGRVSGTLRAGGAMLIIHPEDWAAYIDPQSSRLVAYPLPASAAKHHYVARWITLFNSFDGVEKFDAQADTQPQTVTTVQHQSPLNEAITTDQQDAINAVCKAATARRKQPALLTAARGRGKSAALGLAAGRLIRDSAVREIIVTAGGYKSLLSLFKHARAVLIDSELQNSGRTLQHCLGRLRYIPADKLIAQMPDCDLLIVDEAATLGVTRLAELLKRYSRIAFSSTEQGYEGSGRGFSLKFRALLDRHCRGQYPATLCTPIRWSADDPLEAWVDTLLCLNKPGESPSATPVSDFSEISFTAISQSDLSLDEALLGRVFGLLVDAHYQSRPSDLRALLDAPNTELWAAQHGDTIIGLIWLMHEGGLAPDIQSEIVAGLRRPQGHLAPQILAAHLGLDAATNLRCARIQRIVVRPDRQGQGLGRWMLEQINTQLKQRVDYLASSYGADLPLSRFWHKAGYQSIRLSDKPNAASGLCSALVLRALSPAGQELLGQATTEFAAQFIAQLAGSLRELEPAMAIELCHGTELALADFSPAQLKAAVLFAYAGRPYESCLAALQLLAQKSLFSDQSLALQQSEAWHMYIARILQHQSWKRCAAIAGVSGKQACLKSLRESTRILLETYVPGEALQALHKKYPLATRM